MALDELVKSPRLPAYVDELQRILKEEQQRRERFYSELNEDAKAEFINGEVFMHSPATYAHTMAVKLLTKLLDTYVEIRQLGFVGAEHVLVVLPRNDYEPDVCFFDREKAAQFRPDQLHFPVPDFVAEVLSPSTEMLDRGTKFEDYAANGVAEYWIIDPVIMMVEQYALRDGKYQPSGKYADGTIKSLAVAGFEMPVRAIFDPQVNLRALGRITSSLSRFPQRRWILGIRTASACTSHLLLGERWLAAGFACPSIKSRQIGAPQNSNCCL